MPFSGVGGSGVFRLRTPLFTILGFLTHVQGGRIRKLFGLRDNVKFFKIPQKNLASFC